MSTVIHRLVKWSENYPEATAQRFKAGSEWKTITTKEFVDRVFYLALFLESRGFTQGQVSAIFSYNCPQWVHVDLAACLIRGMSVGIYPNSTRDDIHYIIGHTEASVLSVQNKEYFLKITGKNNEKPVPEHVKMIIVFDGDTSISPKAVSYEKAVEEGRALAKNRRLSDYLGKIKKDDGAFIIYTSGTTGTPKGVMISQDNLAYASDIAIDLLQLKAMREGEGVMFSFLPLCHVAEKIQNLGVGISGHFAVSYCSKFEKVSKEIVEVQPTHLLSVPRLWEKMMEGVNIKLADAPETRKKLAKWAFSVGTKVFNKKLAHEPLSIADILMYQAADKLVLSKVKTAMGLGRMKLCAAGAAALPAYVKIWFRSLGLDILQNFGQAESTAMICMNGPGEDGIGTVGRPIPGTELRIAEDQEILTKGRHVFVGYYKNDEATRQVLKDGWLHTGDLGTLNEKGEVVIKGRKKEIMKTSGGKMVAPLPIEEKLKTAPMISQVCMVGDGRKYISALITLSDSGRAKLKNGNNASMVVDDPAILSEVQRLVNELNSELASYEQVKRFTVLAHDFSIETGEMTPTMKIKRNIVEDRFKDIIDQMYR